MNIFWAQKVALEKSLKFTRFTDNLLLKSRKSHKFHQFLSRIF